jgi:hypothetical protein
MITIARKDIKGLKPTALKPANVQHHDEIMTLFTSTLLPWCILSFTSATL